MPTKCQPCGPGTLQPLQGQTACVPCPLRGVDARCRTACSCCPAGSSATPAAAAPRARRTRSAPSAVAARGTRSAPPYHRRRDRLLRRGRLRGETARLPAAPPARLRPHAGARGGQRLVAAAVNDTAASTIGAAARLAERRAVEPARRHRARGPRRRCPRPTRWRRRFARGAASSASAATTPPAPRAERRPFLRRVRCRLQLPMP